MCDIHCHPKACRIIKSIRSIILIICMLGIWTWAWSAQGTGLNVPLVTQGKLMCGPATIEMLFRFWGVDHIDQYDIARAILYQFPNAKRYRQSGILDSDSIDWAKYPGTGTHHMREFLKRFGKTVNIKMAHEPDTIRLRKQKRDEFFNTVKYHVSRGIPVVVHQYWKLPKSRGHYRLVTGYDDQRREVYLNDANGGQRLVQSYDVFLKLWNVDQKWLHYNAIIFNVDKSKLNVHLR